jgi:putative ABC transport system permease protein
MTANALVALAGGLVAQLQGFVDVNMGMGMIVIGIASILLGETLIGLLPRRLLRISVPVQRTTAAIIGIIAYHGVIAIALRSGIAPTDLKIATAILIVGLILMSRAFGLSMFPLDRY